METQINKLREKHSQDVYKLANAAKHQTSCTNIQDELANSLKAKVELQVQIQTQTKEIKNKQFQIDSLNEKIKQMTKQQNKDKAHLESVIEKQKQEIKQLKCELHTHSRNHEHEGAQDSFRRTRNRGFGKKNRNAMYQSVEVAEKGGGLVSDSQAQMQVKEFFKPG